MLQLTLGQRPLKLLPFSLRRGTIINISSPSTYVVTCLASISLIELYLALLCISVESQLV